MFYLVCHYYFLEGLSIPYCMGCGQNHYHVLRNVAVVYLYACHLYNYTLSLSLRVFEANLCPSPTVLSMQGDERRSRRTRSISRSLAFGI